MLILLLVILIGVVHSIGQWLLPESVASGIVMTKTCDLPCWRGIQPGKTSLNEANILLKANKPFIETIYLGRQGKDVPALDEAVCWSIAVTPRWNGCTGRGILETGPVTQLELTPPTYIFSLGDAVTLFDNPLAVQMCSRFVSVYFPHDVEVVVSAGKFPRLDPWQSVYLVRYLYPGTEPPYQFDTPSWRGFITWRSDITC